MVSAIHPLCKSLITGASGRSAVVDAHRVEPEPQPSPACCCGVRPIAPMSMPSTGTSAPAEEQLLTALQTATDRLIHYATRGTGKQVEPPLTEALSEVEGFCSALEALLAHGFKTRQFLLFTVHPWAFVEHSEKFGELNAEAVRPYTSPVSPIYLP